MSNLVLSREVYCPIDEVWAYHTDLTRAPEWWPNVSECLRIDGEHTPPRTGTGYIWRYNMLGRTFKGAITVREVEPPTRFTFAVEGQINATFRHEYRATAKTRTRITLLVDYEVPSLLGKAVNVLFVERRNAADAEHAFDQLKEHLEGEVIARIDAGVV
jgi:uncharacterized protein YndB with AHSA1/START domain